MPPRKSMKPHDWQPGDIVPNEPRFISEGGSGGLTEQEKQDIGMRDAKDNSTVGFICDVPDYPDVAVVLKRLNGELYRIGQVLPSYMRGKKVLVTVKLYEGEGHTPHAAVEDAKRRINES